ncbi:MAG: hypothetical protein K5981_09295, partial [Clostridia bacterium]|nr:hypothetical protein [Clostridia bacterium]
MIHAGQFAILKSKIDLPDFRSMPLDGGWILSWHSRLSVWQSKDRRALLLGIAWQTDPDRKSPAEEIEKLLAARPEGPAREEIMSMEETWCGRYVLICQDTVFMDATGTLSVFYSP